MKLSPAASALSLSLDRSDRRLPSILTPKNTRLASPNTYGHGGVGSSYCWADPDSGVSFAYLTNSRIPDPWHSRRLDLVANFVHSAID